MAAGDEVTSKFDSTTQRLKNLLDSPTGSALRSSRLRNQADFYSPFGAFGLFPDGSNWEQIAARLKNFIDQVGNEEARLDNEDALK